MISRGARGGPQRRTQIVTLASGDEERNASWANSRRVYDAAYGIRRADDLASVIGFFAARNGRLRGFRWKDWADYKSCLPSASITGFDQPFGTGDGTTTAFQLKKLYISGGQTWPRTILKPVAGTVQAGIVTLQGAELLTSGSNMQSGTWSNTGALGASSAVTYGSFTAAYDLGTTGAGLRQHASVPVQPGKKYRAQVWFKAGGPPSGPASRWAQPARPSQGQTRSAAIRAASGRPSPLGSNQWRFNSSIRAPVSRAVGRKCRFTHALRLTPWSHRGNSSQFVQ